MPHVLVAGRIHPSGIALLAAAADVTHDQVDGATEASYAPLIGRADALVIRTQPLSAATIAHAERLRIVSRHGVGYDSVDVEALDRRGIPLAVAGDVNSVSVAEHAMLLLLAAAKRLVRADRAVRGGDWAWRNRLEAGELSGKHLLILGYGRIGRHLARIAAGFGTVVRAHDPHLSRSGWPGGAAGPVDDLREGLGWADLISVNVPAADRPVIGAAEFAQMKTGAILVNTSRGGVIDEAALAEALHSGRVAAAGLDVLAHEPPQGDNPLLSLDQVVLSPHVAGLTAEAGERLAVASVRNVLDFFAGRLDPALIVNRQALASGGTMRIG